MGAVRVDVQDLADQAYALLQTVDLVNVADGEYTNPPRDDDGRVHALACFYASPGRRYATRFCATPASVVWQFQVICTGGDRDRALFCVDQVTKVLTGQKLTVSGRTTGKIHELGDPGALHVDDKVDPPEHYVSIDFGVFV